MEGCMSEMTQISPHLGMGPSDDSGWKDGIIPGGPGAVYLEDCRSINNDPNLDTANSADFWGNSAIQSYCGARTVFRHSYLHMSHVDRHGTGGMIGARWWEVYENTFYVVQNGNQSEYIMMRAGSPGTPAAPKNLKVVPQQAEIKRLRE
jgi:hypothetical protein